ncbi:MULTISPECIES: hypothetical protein [Moorena]|uniref:Uncharacterized protein n=1 Tax=Moorena producens 3L TaxID=489825 RepID=F4XS30_9CYAN|nr:MULTISPECIES: hypothetical protein [Moorena]EGJ32622.1 hypothetical protein LYNGBM3L_06020 [Moorena producens 3L]NEP34891.1 hypothetical protein [Moorena sp. SIO3B2]NEP66384.1 hypothetical protein [Moorena sp. SIO3A5]NEQ11108.1 hypothetical protein [Moorena sp. SIO4E2]OLT53523.1 hypothetical protein BI334_33145 [Moorena producens 3L]
MEPTPEELLAGSTVIFNVVVPPHILQPTQSNQQSDPDVVVQLRPLTIGTFGLIMKAGKNDPSLIPLLMIKESLVKPALSLEQVKTMHLGLVNFLIAEIRQISGLTEKKT